MKWDDDDVYVIGGLVDVDIRSNASLGTILELVSKELNHFGVIAGLFWQIGGQSSRFVLLCSF